MPIIRTSISVAGSGYNSPFVGPADNPVMIPVLISGLTSAEVDAAGYIKPGVPLDKSGALVGSGVPVFGVTPEAVKVAQSNASGDLTAAGTVDLTVIVICAVNLHLIEANLGRALTTNEKAGFNLAGSTVKLLGN